MKVDMKDIEDYQFVTGYNIGKYLKKAHSQHAHVLE